MRMLFGAARYVYLQNRKNRFPSAGIFSVSFLARKFWLASLSHDCDSHTKYSVIELLTFCIVLQNKKKYETVCHKQLSSYQTHTTFMYNPPTRSFPDNLCQVHTFFSHLFRFYLLLSCLRILAFHHSLWFITIIPDTRRPLPELCSFECCVPTVLSEHKSGMMLSLLCLSSTSALPHAHTKLFLYLFVRTYNSKQPRSDSISLRSNRLPYSPKP